MTQAAAFRATFADWKLIKTRSVVQVVFEVPLEQADAAYRVLGGMPDPGAERWCAVARLNRDGLATVPVEAAGPCGETLDRPHKPRKPVAADKRLAQQAGICCADPVFQRFLMEDHQITGPTEDQASEYVRAFCKIGSRSEIIPGSNAADRWEYLRGRFLAWKLAA